MKTSTYRNLAASQAADYLAQALGGRPSHWEIWLANERRPNRVNRMLECEPGPGRPRYSEEKLLAFLPLYKEKHSKKNATDEGSPRKSERLTVHVSAITGEESPHDQGVLFVTMNPLRTYKLTVEEARQLSRRLAVAAEDVAATDGENKGASE